jgi:hypothetical protein
MSHPIREDLCPFCASPNQCGVADPGGCWCGRIEIPMELIELLPEDRKFCICRACVDAYKQDPQGFVRINRTNPT